MDIPSEMQAQYWDKYKPRQYAAPSDDAPVTLGYMNWGYKQTYDVVVYDLDASDVFPGQTVGLDHVVQDEDILCIIVKR